MKKKVSAKNEILVIVNAVIAFGCGVLLVGELLFSGMELEDTINYYFLAVPYLLLGVYLFLRGKKVILDKLRFLTLAVILLFAVSILYIIAIPRTYWYTPELSRSVTLWSIPIMGFISLFTIREKSRRITYIVVYLLMILFAFIGQPRIDGILEKSRDGATKGNLAAIRCAISIYHDENKGIWPEDLTSNFTSYLYPIPTAKATVLGNSSDVTIVDGAPKTKGKGWAYNPKTGEIWANSIKKDTKRVPYSSY